MTEEKVRLLLERFPEAEESSILELLLSCNGSVSATESFLLEAFPNFNPMRTTHGGNKQQQNIRRLFGDPQADSLVKSTNTKNLNKPINLYSKESIESTIPYATIHFNFLPKELSNSLLKTTLDDTEGFKSPEFHLFGNKCVANHTNKLYTAERLGDLYYNGKKVIKTPYNDELKAAQLLIEDLVNKELQQRQRLPFQSTSPSWSCDFTLCNRFDNKSNNLDWHSDRLTYIGPHCTIASLSLGATREFRVRKQYNDSGSKFNPIYSISLPHNTLLVMHAGFQEQYKHCVSSTTDIEPHEISGPTRLNFTYRNYLPNFRDKIPMCSKCGNQMDLRRSYKTPESRGRYIWLCTAKYNNKECNGFHWANFNSEKLYTDNLDECSIWIPKDDHEALKCYRDWINERLASSSSSTSSV